MGEDGAGHPWPDGTLIVDDVSVGAGQVTLLDEDGVTRAPLVAIQVRAHTTPGAPREELLVLPAPLAELLAGGLVLAQQVSQAAGPAAHRRPVWARLAALPPVTLATHLLAAGTLLALLAIVAVTSGPVAALGTAGQLVLYVLGVTKAFELAVTALRRRRLRRSAPPAR